MKLEEQICSLELSKQLKSLGFKQDSLFYHVKCNGSFDLGYTTTFKSDNHSNLYLNGYGNIEFANEGIEEIYSAYTVVELGEMLPARLERVSQCDLVLIIEKQEKSFMVCYQSSYGQSRHYSVNVGGLAQSMAKMLIYLKENNLI